MEVLIESLGDLLSGRPSDTDAAVQAAAEIFDQWWAVRAQAQAPNVGAPGPGHSWGGHQARHRQSQQPPPGVNADAELRGAARRVLGFSASERLTVDLVKDRRRMLAKKHHPDRGGSVAMMARINDAADVLLASL